MNKISLIGTTRGGRLSEISRLLASLDVELMGQVEIIFVDQSGTESVRELFDEFQGRVSFKLISSSLCSLSKARNIGLKLATGNIIGFCDDDAFYDEASLRYLLSLTSASGQVISVPVKDKSSGANYAGRSFPLRQKNLGYLGIIRYSLSVGTFLYLPDGTTAESIVFNENLGAGTALGGSEETELFFRLISHGFEALFDNNARVFHDNDPVVSGSETLPKKYEIYAVGYAVVIKAYMQTSKFLLLAEVFRVIARCSAGLFFPSKRLVCFYRLKGFLRGLTLKGLG